MLTDAHHTTGTQRIFFDVTETSLKNYGTGIQRAVTEILRGLGEISDETISIVPVKITKPRAGGVNLTMVRATVFGGLDPTVPTDFLEPASPNGQMEQTARERMGSRLYGMGASIWNSLASGPFSFATDLRASNFIADNLVSWIRSRIISPERPAHIVLQAQSNDFLLICDSYWGRGPEDFLGLIETTKIVRKTVLLVHDVIHLSHPDLVQAKSSRDFNKYATQLYESVDEICFISEFSKKSFLSFFPQHLSKAGPVIHLAPTKFILPETAIVERPPNSIVCLGTLDSRKNISFVLDWFELFGSDWILTLVGRPGWDSKSLKSRLLALTQKHSNLHWRQNANDELLAGILSSHVIGLAPSSLEGFGLPLVEFSNFGMKVVANDIPVFREVAPKGTIFFQSESLEELQKCLLLARISPPVEPVRRSWADVAADLQAELQLH